MIRKPTIRKSKNGTKPVAPIQVEETPVKTSAEIKAEVKADLKSQGNVARVKVPRGETHKIHQICTSHLPKYTLVPKLEL